MFQQVVGNEDGGVTSVVPNLYFVTDITQNVKFDLRSLRLMG